MAVELVYETHSSTVDNERGIATGRLPGELGARPRAGRRARRAPPGRRDRGGLHQRIRRAVETVEIAFDGSEIPVHHDARLRECEYGELNGAPVERVTAVRRLHVDEPFPGGESYRQVVERTRAFLDDVVAAHDGERIAVIAHSANRRALDHLVDGAPLEQLVDGPFAWLPGPTS
jgi:broad specificity phosphatase PhoE